MRDTAADTPDSTRCYEALPLNALPLSQLMAERHRFADVPADWHVVITDVKKSTQALSNGMHHLVNLVATGSIIAALNISRRADTRVPFFRRRLGHAHLPGQPGRADPPCA
ncbi:MAG: DUF3095 domain-containing protein [Betaproteobacteria bacterium]|nr:DUF3095 domain-containing protein [Betaproteobacteria bacterium]